MNNLKYKMLNKVTNGLLAVTAVILLIPVLITSGCSGGDIGDLAVDELPISQYPHYVAVGDSGVIYYSYDAKIWTQATTVVGESLAGVVYGGGKFVAVGNSGNALYSSDGINWNLAAVAGGIPLHCIAYGGGTYVASGQYQPSNVQVWTSTDGITWSDHSFYNISGDNVYGIAYGNGRFYMAGAVTSGWFSDNYGVTWTTSFLTSGTEYYGVVYANAKYTAVGAGSMVMESPTAQAGSWSAANTGTLPNVVRAIAYGNGRYVIVGEGSGGGGIVGQISYSVDGKTWSSGIHGASVLNAVAYGNGIFVAVGESSEIWYSEDGGVNWNMYYSSAASLRAVAFRP